jgi:diguanylate cyclase (GGDEF)-like protein
VVNKVLRDEINRARRNATGLSVILLDVDYFKKYNDSYGHIAGDEVLQRLAELMQRVATRAGEVATRYGGEEFMLVLPGATKDSAVRTAIRLKNLVLAEEIIHLSSPISKFLTISQGVITITPKGQLEPDELIERVDKALYRAKDLGRNTISVVSNTIKDIAIAKPPPAQRAE